MAEQLGIICGFDEFVANGGLNTHPVGTFCVKNFYGLDPVNSEDTRPNELMERMVTDPLWRQAYASAVYTQALDEEKAWQASCKDEMTGLYNTKGLAFYMRQRMAQVLLFNEQYADVIASGEVEPKQLVGILIDIDRFKEVNDKFGHDYGDRILREVGEKVRASDIVGVRIHGDEFAILAFNSTETDTDGGGLRGQAQEPIEQRIEKFKRALRARLQPLFEDVGVRGLDLSMGHVIWDGTQTPEEFIKTMDDAMYVQKALNNLELYQSDPLWQRALARMAMRLLGWAGNAAKDIRKPR